MPNRARTSVDHGRGARLTVAHVNVARGYRGGERQTELLIRQLQTHGVEQVLVARRGEALARRVADADVEVREVHGDPFGTCRATRGVDVVHVHEGRSVYGAWLRSVISGTPYIATRRVNNPIGDHFLAHRAYRGAIRVVAVSPQVAEIVRDYDAAIEVTVVYDSSSGLTSDAERTAKIRSAFPGSFVIGHVGALGKQKGQEFIIEVAAQFAEAHPEVCFVLVGSGEDEGALKNLAAGLGNVVFTGFVDNVGDYLAAFDLFVFPSRWEGLGSTLLDAMAFGLPVVATPVGGVPSVVHDGENGILVATEDADALAHGIERLLASAELRRSMGETGRRFSAGFSPEIMCERYLEIYESVVGKSSA